MKKIIATLVFMCFIATSWAQTTDTVKISVNGSELIIITEDWDEISKKDFNVIVEKTNAEAEQIEAEHARKIAAVDKQLASGDITEEEAAKFKEGIADETAVAMEELAEKVEQWAEEYAQKENAHAEDVETWAEAWEANAEAYENNNPQDESEDEDNNTTIIINDDGIVVKGKEWNDEEYRDTKYKYKNRQTHGYFEMYFGWNNWFDENGLAAEVDGSPLTTTELDFWPSMTWGFGFGGRTRFGDSKFLVRYGAQFNWHYFRLKGNNVLVKRTPDLISNFDGTTVTQDPTKNYSKSTFRINYLDVPLMFEFDTSERGLSNGFSLGIGGYGGIRLNSSTKICYTDGNGDRSKQVTHNNFYANGYRYGAMVQIGFGVFKITGKWDLDYLFRADKSTPDYQVGSLTFGWVFP